jgi:hypothetical protein
MMVVMLLLLAYIIHFLLRIGKHGVVLLPPKNPPAIITGIQGKRVLERTKPVG